MNLKCLKCGSEDVFQKQDGSCLCGACGHRFMPQQEPAEFVPMRLFISYGHKESEICRRIYQALKERGHQPWFDEDQIRFGHDWRERLANGIEASNSVVACLSQYSTREKGVCLDELAISVGVKGGNIVSILLDDVNPPSAVSHRQWLDMRDWEEKLDAGEDVFKPWFDAKMAELYAVLESEENREFSGQITELQNRLTIYYSTSRQAKLLRNSFVGRAWLNDAITNWLQDDTAPRTCLLTGAPGVGKSAYAAHFTHYNDHVAAALFCSSEMNTFNDPRTVIQTVAYLMACRLTAYRQSLMLHLPEDRAAVQRLSEKELFEQLISKPLSLSVNGNHERMVILLDGLDECGSPEKNALAKTLYEYADSLPDWLRILLVARDIPAISVYTKGAYRIEIGSESKDNLQDIRSYYRFELESRFGDDPHWDDALERMTARSQGIFLYAQMLTDLLRSRGTLGATEEYPDGLDAVFTRWFSWFFNESDFRSFWRPAISCILGSPAPLPAETLRRVMHWGENELADFRARLKVLLRVEKNEFDEETLVFDHAFVREWLTRGAGENVYFCSPKDGAEKLTAELFSIFERGPEELSFWEAVHLMDLPLEEGQREEIGKSLDLVRRATEAGNYCETWGRLTPAENIYQKALSLSEECCCANESDDAFHRKARCLDKLSHLAKIKGLLPRAMKMQETVLSIEKSLVEKNPSDCNRKTLAKSYLNMGIILQMQGFLEKALELYQKGFYINKDLSTKLDTPESMIDLAASYDCIGFALWKKEKTDEALEQFQKSCTIRESLKPEHNTLDYLRDLAICYNNMGIIYNQKVNWDVALELYQKSLSIRKDLNAKLGTPDSLLMLAGSYNNIGAILYAKGNLDGALELYNKSLSINKDLSSTVATTDVFQNLATNCSNMGDIYHKKGDLKRALELYRKSLDIFEDLRNKLDTSEAILSLASNCFKTAYVLLANGDLDEAKNLCHKCLSACEDLNKKLDTQKSMRILAANYNEIGGLLEACNDWIEALELYKKGLALHQKLSNSLGTPVALHDELASCTCIVSILYDHEKYEEAYPYAVHSLTISQKLSSALRTDAARDEEAHMLNNLFLLQSHLNDNKS
jgi:tetratricopeptide (TPR) repeat protein/uncharacterized Zn finger protein (UPF0148 family)